MALIDIASRNQLFVDDYLIESMSHCALSMNRAEKVVDNPVLRPEHPWEGFLGRLGLYCELRLPTSPQDAAK